MFLRAFSYGDSIEIDVECPHCGNKDKHKVTISSFKSKDLEHHPNENGEISLITEKFNIPLKIHPRTYIEELEFNKKNKNPIEKLCFYITDLGGITDKASILKKISTLKLVESRDVRKCVFDNLPGINASTEYQCALCDKTTKIDFGNDGADFLKLPSSFMNNVLEEIFLLTHYGNGISIADAKKMPVGERRWLINRLSEEIQKKNEAEKAAVAKAKNKR
jgi:DNA-directed RNA polymerase subunit RPC12/RpoP